MKVFLVSKDAIWIIAMWFLGRGEENLGGTFVIRANQPIPSFLVRCLNPCLQGTSVRVRSPQPTFVGCMGCSLGWDHSMRKNHLMIQTLVMKERWISICEVNGVSCFKHTLQSHNTIVLLVYVSTYERCHMGLPLMHKCLMKKSDHKRPTNART